MVFNLLRRNIGRWPHAAWRWLTALSVHFLNAGSAGVSALTPRRCWCFKAGWGALLGAVYRRARRADEPVRYMLVLNLIGRCG